MDQPMHGWLTRRGALSLWMLTGALMLGTLPLFPVTRTQEARVLATAREMLASGEARQWVLPELNGELRLKKPPLAYWMTAGSYAVFGVNEWAGRLPMALLGWGMIGLTYAAAMRLGFGIRAAMLGAGTMAGTYLFFRYSRMAETDIPAAFFVTAAIYFFWNGFDADPANSTAGRRRFWHLHLAAAMTGLAVLGKGPPAIFPPLFLIAMAATERRWDVPWRLVRSGALLTLAVIALPWFAYVQYATQTTLISREIEKIAGGEGHWEPVYNHILYLFKATAPWIAFVILALVVAIPRWKSDPKLRGLMIWAAVILIPLSSIGQKQEHYLLPIMPPLMILTGWVMDLALRREDRRITETAALMLKGTIVAGFLAGIAIPIGAKLERGALRIEDFLIAGVVVVLMTAATLLYRVRGFAAGASAGVAAWGLVIALGVGVWGPGIERPNYEDVAHALERVDSDGPFAFHPIPSLPLVFYLEQVVPVLATEGELNHALDADPGLTIIFERDEDEPAEPPGNLVKQFEMTFDEKVIAGYRRENNGPSTQMAHSKR